MEKDRNTDTVFDFGGVLLPTNPYYATLGQQIRAELDREAEAVAYLEARGYKIIKKEGTS